MSDALDELLWPADRAGDALESLCAHVNLGARGVRVPAPRPSGGDGDLALERWFDDAARLLGVEVEPVECGLSEVEGVLARAAPTLLAVPHGPSASLGFALLTGFSMRWGRGPEVRLLAPSGATRAVSAEALCAAMVAPWVGPHEASVEALLTSAGVAPERRARAARWMLAQRLASVPVGRGWLLRSEPGSPVGAQLGRAGAGRRVMALLAAQAGLQGLGALGWWLLLGSGALEGTLDPGWLGGWWLALGTMVPLELLASWQAGMLAFEVGAVFKQRMLVGALRLAPDVTRREGAGALLGRVIESSALERSALNGAVLGLSVTLQLGSALVVLLVGAQGPLPSVVFVLWCAFAVGLVARHAQAQRAWTDVRMSLTADLVERMLGHRTRLAQEPPDRWHDDEDRALEAYTAESRTMDDAGVRVDAWVSRGWPVVGVLSMLPGWMASGAGELRVAVGVAALWAGAGALRAVVAVSTHVAAAWIAWRSAGPVFVSAAAVEPAGTVHRVGVAGEGERRAGEVVLDLQAVGFSHQGRAEPTLRGVNLQVRAGDRLLVEGPSGGGKSTLGTLLAGLRAPTSGLLLLGGLDLQSVGATAWRRRVVLAPQFHENHVQHGTLAFNLLMGRRWPPSSKDLTEAEALCVTLGLGPLLARMPSGLQQIVGGTGWRLSHGEKSRIFLARALLQGAEVVVLDESLGALDPETMTAALACVLQRARTLVMIAHR